MFDQGTRNRLQKFVGEARTLLSDEFSRQLQQDYGLDPNSGEVSPLESLYHLDAARLETARLLRDTLEHYQAGSPTGSARDILQRIVREQAFTVLNRLCALRMAEAREILLESIGKGYQSPGFQLYARLAGTALGDTGGAYRCYLFSLFDEFAVDLAVLFDRFAPTGRLFPRETALLELLDKLNHPDLETLWAQDETIGWIYQYFNSQEERRQMRAESQAPRNSRELAVRNQFFTPRYVVEFLTDNTLGRIWYEMTEGNTALVHNCRYLVRRPMEIFLAPGEQAPEQETDTDTELSQEALLKQAVYIPHRPLKDPRTIRMLDPACGSMHFGLYAFDLYERIYEEAWTLEETHALERSEELQALRTTYTNDYEGFRRDIPRLILEYNIHGVDIDPRAAQIAGLSLWLRAQRSWKEQSVKAAERPRIERSNVVCAEPMPGEKDLLREFAASLHPPVLGQLVMHIFEKMELAGEAGSLLKIEEEIAGAVEKARQAFAQEVKVGRQSTLFAEAEQGQFDFSGLGRRTNFWEQAEQRILDALQVYAEQAEGNIRRRLFARDTARGFAFIDLCRKRYDVVLMNPPFGGCAENSLKYLKNNYEDGWKEAYAGFFERSLILLNSVGLIGAITSLQYFYAKQLKNLRISILKNQHLRFAIELGSGVLDSATVDTALTVLSRNKNTFSFFLDLLNDKEKENSLKNVCLKNLFIVKETTIFKGIENSPLCYHVDEEILKLWEKPARLEPDIAEVVAGNITFDDFRFLRLRWEVYHYQIDDFWYSYVKGGDFFPIYNPSVLLFNWFKNGQEPRAFQIHVYGTDAQTLQSIKWWFKPGITYPRVSSIGFSPRVLPKGSIFSEKGMAIFPNKTDDALTLLGILSSSWIEEILNAFGRHRAYENSAVGNLPIDILHLDKSSNQIKEIVSKILELLQYMFSMDENSPIFKNILINYDIKDSLFVDFVLLFNRLDEIVAQVIFLNSKINSNIILEKRSDQFVKYCLRPLEELSAYDSRISYFTGIVFARWDIRYATGAKLIPELPDPFASIPICPPGMLQNAQGLPASPEDVTADYPLRLSWGGILVDDEGHPEDIVGRLREVLAVIWAAARAGDIEQEACNILGVKTLRDYFRAPGKFFAEHLKRYSKSRRQAPIYWPLATPSGSYTLWLYCHRLNNQTLYTAVNDFVEPKLRQVDQQSNTLRSRSGRSKTEEIELETLITLEQELRELRDELLRVAAFWKPNLNDGVVITAAPLWRLFQYKPWQKTLKATWQSLEKGDYDWAHLAYSIWPERVLRVAQKDRSIAIAHDLEDALWVQVKDEKGKEKWVARELREEDMQDILKSKNMKMF